MGNINVRGLDPARASARSTGRLLAALVIALCALMTGVHDAYAITVRDDGNGYKRAIVYPHDYPDGRYAALTEFLGYDWNSFSQQTKTAIIEDDGKFMELYRARCKNYRYENENLQDGSGSVIGAISTKLAEVVDSVSGTVFGNDKTWYCSCTNEDYEAARENIEQWLYPNDGNNNSGGGGETEGELSLPNSYALQYFAPPKWDDRDSLVLNYGTTPHNTIETYLTNNTEYKKCVVIAYNTKNNPRIKMYLMPENMEYQTLSRGIQFTNPYPTSQNIAIYRSEADYSQVSYSSGIINVTGLRTVQTQSINGNRGTFSEYIGEYSSVVTDLYGSSGGSGGGEPYEPTPDPTPTPPVIQIGDVTIDLSNGPYTVNNVTYTAVLDNDNNWTVQITSNTTNNYGGDVQATDPTDYTSILNAILAAINSLRSEMTTYCNQINTAINTMSTNIQTAIKNADTSISGHIKKLNEQVHADIQTLQTNLQNNFNDKFDAYTTQLWSNMAALDADLLESIYNAAVYIVDGLQFDGGWDDDEIVKWLKLIYSRVKDKKVTVRSVDEDPKGWLDDLKRVLDELLNVILSGLNVATLATAFEGLKARFPISIPWDIAAIVNMFAGGAVTPVFDLPLPNGDGTMTMVHVDLHEWDDEMALVRQGELLLFGIALMYNTKWMFDTITTTFRRGD